VKRPIDGTNIVYKKDIITRQAVDLGHGLIVPSSEGRPAGLVGSRRRQRLADRARTKKLSPRRPGRHLHDHQPRVFGSLFGRR